MPYLEAKEKYAALAAEYYMVFVVCIPELVEARYAVFLFTVLVLISLSWSFVLLSRYNNSVGRIIINSYCIGFTHSVRIATWGE